MPARTTPRSGTSAFIVQPFPRRARAPMLTRKFTVTPMPTSTPCPTITSPASIAPGAMFEFSAMMQSCETMAPVLMMHPKPTFASLPTYASGIICTPLSRQALASMTALGWINAGQMNPACESFSKTPALISIFPMPPTALAALRTPFAQRPGRISAPPNTGMSETCPLYSRIVVDNSYNLVAAESSDHLNNRFSVPTRSIYDDRRWINLNLRSALLTWMKLILR